jgi:hypothetical protein
MRNVLRWIRQLLYDRQLAIMFALCAAPLLVMIGLGVDYHRKLAEKSPHDTVAAVTTLETKKVPIGAETQGQSDILPAAATNPGKARDKVACASPTPDRSAPVRFQPPQKTSTQPLTRHTPVAIRQPIMATHILKICGTCKNTYSDVETEPSGRPGISALWRPTKQALTRPSIHQRFERRIWPLDPRRPSA